MRKKQVHRSLNRVKDKSLGNIFRCLYPADVQSGVAFADFLEPNDEWGRTLFCHPCESRGLEHIQN